MGLREQKRQQLLDRIVETTCELIESVGYEATQVEEVVRRLEISKPTFYRYFDSKSAVLAEVQARMTHAWAVEVEGALASGLRDQGFETVLVDLARFSARDLLANEPLSRAVYLHTSAAPPTSASGDRVRAAEERAERSMKSLFEMGQVSGQVATRYPADLLALIVESVLESVGYVWALGEIESKDLEGALVLAFDASFNGFRSASANDSTDN